MKKRFNANSPAFWAIVAVLLCAVAAAFLLIDTKGKKPDKDEPVPTEAEVSVTETPRPTQENTRKRIELSAKDAAELEGLFGEAERWLPCGPKNAGMEWAREFFITVGGRDYAYSSFEHMFFDEEADRRFSLTFSEYKMIETALGNQQFPFELPSAKGFSADDGLRIGVMEVGFPANGYIGVIWDNVGSEPVLIGDSRCLYKLLDDGSEERVPYSANVEFGDGAYELPAHSFEILTSYLDLFGDLEPGSYRLYLNGTEPGGLWIDFTLRYPLLYDAESTGGSCADESIIIRVSGVDYGDEAVTLTVAWLNTGSSTFTFTGGWNLYENSGDAPNMRSDILYGGDESLWGLSLIVNCVTPEDEEYRLEPGELLYVDYTIDNGYLPKAQVYTIVFAAPSCDCRAVFRTLTEAERYWELMQEHPEYDIWGNKPCKLCAVYGGEFRCSLIRTTALSAMSDDEIREFIMENGISAKDMRIIMSNRYIGIDEIRVLGADGASPPEPELAEAQLRQLLLGEPERTGEEAEKRLEQLKREHAKCFGVPAENGLEVYVWQFSKGTLCFGLRPKPAPGAQEWTVWTLDPVSDINDMKLILSTYEIPPESIEVIPYDHPTSYYEPVRGVDYIPGIRRLLGLD